MLQPTLHIWKIQHIQLDMHELVLSKKKLFLMHWRLCLKLLTFIHWTKKVRPVTPFMKDSEELQNKPETNTARGHLRHQIQTNERILTLWPIEKLYQTKIARWQWPKCIINRLASSTRFCLECVIIFNRPHLTLCIFLQILIFKCS